MALAADDIATLSRLLDEALALDISVREAWLAGLPAAHAPLVEPLRQMLAEHAESGTGDRLSTLPKFGAEDATARAGEQVGDYTLIREIGRGGMGSVWLAERSDGVLKRRIALKLPHPGLGTRNFAEQLARERNILASLAHPNIARLYDAGVTAQGQPYMALAYVQGQTLIEHCDAKRLSVRERVLLFQQVLAAVQHAHVHLVLHRDIKPSNVLVDEQGQVQLLDFGIAKLMVDGQADATQLTLDGGRMMTPDYASPEQIAGEPLSTASDVYSLGVLLYELLAGLRPYRLQPGSHAGLEHAVMATDPRLPSTAAKDATVASNRGMKVPALIRSLRGDLDAIVLKALQKPAALRYATAEALRLDLQRHLDGEPVLAQPYNALYRLRKLVGRNRLPTAFAAATVAALLIGAGVATWQAKVATHERDNALRLLSRNEAISEFLDMFITEAAQSPTPLTAGELLARSEVLADSAFRNAPEHQALVLSILGAHNMNLGDLEKAESLMTRARDAAHDSTDLSFKARLECQRAIVQVIAGRKEARETLLAEAQRKGVGPAVAAECYDGLSLAAQLGLDGPAAAGFSRQALASFTASGRGSPAVEAEYIGTLAYALHMSGRNAEAESEFARAMAIYARLGREGNSHAMTVLSNWATMNSNAGDARAALAHYDEIVTQLARRGIGDAPPAPEMLAYRARALGVVGRRDEAAEAYGRALAAAERVDDRDAVFICLLGEATLAIEANRVDAAERFLRRMEGVKASGSFVARGLHFLRARIAQAQGRPAEARAEYDATVAVAKTKPNTTVALTRRAEFGLTEGRLADALKDARAARELALALQGGKPYSVHTGMASLVEGRILAAQGEVVAARAAYELARLHLSNTVDAGHAGLVQVQSLLQEATR